MAFAEGLFGTGLRMGEWSSKTGNVKQMAPVAVIMPGAFGWEIAVRSADNDNQYVRPQKLRDATYRTRAEAIDGARRVFAAQRP